MTDVDDLADRLALHELVARHGHLVDAGDLASLDEVFLPDVAYDVTDLGGTVMAGLVEVEAASRRLGDGNPVAHHVTNIVVTSLTDDVAHVMSKGLGVAGDGTVGSVVYDDEAVRTPTGWRIRRRTVRARRAPLRP
jgi:hypothetical protein